MALRFLLDTNILSLLDPRRADQRGHLPAWLSQHGSELALASITLTEIENGLLKLRRLGQTARASEIEALAEAIRNDFADRILPLDSNVAVAIAHLAERARPMVIELPDLIVAATAHVHGLKVLTRNLRHMTPPAWPRLIQLTRPPIGQLHDDGFGQSRAASRSERRGGAHSPPPLLLSALPRLCATTPLHASSKLDI